ncbi:MAG: phosphoribosylamine--glycine ligase [Candidatus Omnitrophica bacterium 4484_70.2]|nr:MAG: phosphoribosylamine--glycine ligase [Candidatus Omnitrophica bacterium 4484_70.2]
MKVLIVGGGGREHCLAWKIKQSLKVKKIYCAPGNGGTSSFAQNIDVPASDLESLLNFALKEKIDLTVIGPEAPLVEGIVDLFEEKGLKIFGPKEEAAKLEASKVFAKQIMKKYAIPTADFCIFDDPYKAKKFAEKSIPCVVKADGLAQGKGSIICKSREGVEEAVELMMIEKKFGKAGERIVIEEFLEGEEASILAFVDGESYLLLVPSQDHKPVFDNDEGPNTGGMGAYAPAPLVNGKIMVKIKEKIFAPLLKALKKENIFFRGILYAGLMIKNEEPFVLEFNVRFGDPETQAILPKLKTDLVDLMLETIEGKLEKMKLDWDERFCVCVVLASGGYPGKYEKGKKIEGLGKLNSLEDILVFHAGTKKVGNDYLSWGGRVLNVVGLDFDLKRAQEKVYEAIKNIYFEKMHYRKDIACKAFKYLE